MKYILLIFTAATINHYSIAQKKAVIKGEEEIIYPFETNSEKMYFDWTKNNQNFDNIQVLAMGEATHGTKDFFDIKAKSFEYLAKHEDFRIFGIEASYGECSYINDYIQTGIGNIDSVMNYFNFCGWRTVEVKKFIVWMKDYNQENTEKLKFYGFDMASKTDPIEYLEHFFKHDTSNYVHSLNEIISPIISKKDDEVSLLYKNDSLNFKDTLKIISNDLEKWFNNNESALIDKYTPRKLKLLKYHLITYNQAINIHGNAYNYRDSCMAKNILEILKMENEKMFLWTHNGHVNKASPRYKQMKWMGEHLSEKLQLKYYALGFVFSKGSFQAYVKNKKKKYDFKVTTLPTYRRNTFTKQLDELGEEQFFIDVQQSKNTLFKKKLRTYDIGSVFFKKKWSSFHIIAKEQFDGIIYIRNTASAVPIK